MPWSIQHEGAASGTMHGTCLTFTKAGVKLVLEAHEPIYCQARVLILIWPGSNGPVLANGILLGNSEPFYLIKIRK